MNINPFINKIKFLKKNKKKIGLCHGVFDVIHIGHISHFEYAKKKCDFLIVSVTTDKFVNKGKDRPIFSIKERTNLLKKIKDIDLVISSNFESALQNISLIKPDFYFKDKEYQNGDLTGNIVKEKKKVEQFGGKIVFTKLKKYSSSNIVNSLNFNNENKKNKNFHVKIKKDILLKTVLNSNLKPLIIGEGIIDHYVFTSGLGKSGKESILTVSKEDDRKYFGGSIAIAKNFSSFSKEVGLIFDYGDDKKTLNFVKQNNEKNINLLPLKKTGCQFNRKIKLLDSATKNKILGIYDLKDRPLSKSEETKLFNLVKKNIRRYDFIVISDYDHGLINKNLFNKLKEFKKPIIATSQLNASNVAYHDLLKLNGSDLLIINSNELKSFYKRKYIKNNNIVKMSKYFLKNSRYKNMIVTIGKDGSYFFSRKEFYHFPAMVKNEEGDKIGSGDTFLVCAALGFIKKLHPLGILCLGSVSAKINLLSFANDNNITKKNILDVINSTINW